MHAKARTAAVIAHRMLGEQVNEFLGAAYGTADLRQREWKLKIAHRLQQWFTALGEYSQGRVLLLEGDSCHTGQPFRVAMLGCWTCGERNNRLFYQHLLFRKGIAEITDQGPVRMYQLQEQAKELASAVDLVLVLGNSIFVRPPVNGEWALGPYEVRMVFDFRRGETWEEVESRMRQCYNLKIIRRCGLTYRLSYSDEDFHFFYHHLYVPMVKSRFKDFGDILHEPGLYQIFKKNGAIVLIEDGEGDVVGGGLVYLWRGVFYALLNGVRNFCDDKLRQGALNAFYYYSMQYAFENGYRRFDTGCCEPFINDGIYIHKQRWGCASSLDYWKPLNLLCWAPNAAPEAITWLRAHPMLPCYARWGGEEMQNLYQNLQPIH